MSHSISVGTVHYCSCCICQKRISYQEIESWLNLNHSCHLASSMGSTEGNTFHTYVSIHKMCYTSFLESYKSGIKAEIMHSILCYHISSIYPCRMKSLNCLCNQKYKFQLYHMEEPHAYSLCGECSQVYDCILEHAANDKHFPNTSVPLSTGDLQFERECFIPFCSEARRECAFSNHTFKWTNSYYNCFDATNIRLYQRTYSENKKIKIGSIIMDKGAFQTNRDFHYIRHLGTGTNGEVWLAHTNNSECFAIKKFFSDVCADGSPTTNEATILSSLNHPNIVECFGGLELDRNNVMFIEYASFDTLDRHIMTQNGLGPFQTLFYLRQLASALAYLHSRSIMHRDIKTDNVLLFNAGYLCKLTDFSEATYYDSNIGPAKYKIPHVKTQTDVRGSPLYFAPEIVFGYGNFFKSDIWSLGILTYKMLCSILPHEAECNEIYQSITRNNPNSAVRISILTMNSFFVTIKNTQDYAYFKQRITQFIHCEFESLLSVLFDLMLCFDTSKRGSANYILNEILCDKIYQQNYLKEFNMFDCCEECNIKQRIYNFQDLITTEYGKKETRPGNNDYQRLVRHGLKRFPKEQGVWNQKEEYQINIYTDWQFWFRFLFDFRPKFEFFLVHFLMPVISSTSHEDFFVLMFDEVDNVFINNSPQKLDTYCHPSYYCFLSKALLDKNTISSHPTH